MAQTAGNIRVTGNESVENPETSPNPGLLASLGHLVRGLSVLFWGLPMALVICWQSAEGDWFKPLGVVPALLATTMLLYGLQLLAQFQPQERIWHTALDRARIFALINVGLSPFLHWSYQLAHPFFIAMEHIMFVSGLCFLFSVNPVLWRLAAMLPDETLRLETRLFTTINRYLLFVTILVSLTYFWFAWANPHFRIALPIPPRAVTAMLWATLFLFLLPVAMTMALTWKIKEAVFSSVFGAPSR